MVRRLLSSFGVGRRPADPRGMKLYRVPTIGTGARRCLAAKHASLRRAGVHGCTPRACAKQGSQSAMCPPPSGGERRRDVKDATDKSTLPTVSYPLIARRRWVKTPRSMHKSQARQKQKTTLFPCGSKDVSTSRTFGCDHCLKVSGDRSTCCERHSRPHRLCRSHSASPREALI